MKNIDKLSSKTVKAIESFIIEFEQSYTRPNQVFMSEEIYLAVKKEFPYLIDRGYYDNGKYKLKVILTKDENQSVGVSYSYDINNLMEEING